MHIYELTEIRTEHEARSNLPEMKIKNLLHPKIS